MKQARSPDPPGGLRTEPDQTPEFQYIFTIQLQRWRSQAALSEGSGVDFLLLIKAPTAGWRWRLLPEHLPFLFNSVVICKDMLRLQDPGLSFSH